MTTAKKTSRGRGLDALFDGSTTATPSSAAVEADLAALLNQEVQAASPATAYSYPSRAPASDASAGCYTPTGD